MLGADTKRLLGETRLHRAAALLRGDKPENPAERDLARRLREAEPLRRAR